MEVVVSHGSKVGHRWRLCKHLHQAVRGAPGYSQGREEQLPQGRDQNTRGGDSLVVQFHDLQTHAP